MCGIVDGCEERMCFVTVWRSSAKRRCVAREAEERGCVCVRRGRPTERDAAGGRSAGLNSDLCRE